MSNIITGYNYDIFISYRQKDNKHDGWVTEFVDHLKGELESTFKEEISVYFDINPQDGLLETHDVDASLKEKLKCLVFIPIISRTYCDPRSFAWEHEFKAFIEQASQDQLGLKVNLHGGNVSSRVLPIKINDLDPEDKTLLENELGGVLRCIEFVYKSAGVNRPLRAHEDHPQDNLNKTYYRDQINKVALAIKEIILAIEKRNQPDREVPKEVVKVKPGTPKYRNPKIIIASVSILALLALGYFFIPKLVKSLAPVEKSIAVLPFTNLSNDPEQEYFSDGMVDAILDHLFKVGDLKVISRTSSMRYKNTKLTLKEIAHELGVSALLEGSVQKIGDKVRITAQLIDTKTDTHVWSETYVKNLSDIFSIQSEVAQNVARELKVTLTSDETQRNQNAPLTTSQLAYDYYLKGNNYISRYIPSIAVEMYTKAIREDPFFAAAYAGRAHAYLQFYWFKKEKLHDPVLKAQEDIKKGLSINPELPELKIDQAYYYYFVTREYEKALNILTELKKITPNMPSLYFVSANVLRRQGKWDESIIERERGLQFDPFNAGNINDLGYTYYFLHQYDKAIEWCKKGLSLIPDYENFKFQMFDALLGKTGDLQVALKESGLQETVGQYQLYYYTRQYDKLLEFIQDDSITRFSRQIAYYLKTFEFARIYFLSGNKSLCKIYADSSITLLKEKIKESPKDERFYATLGKCYAFIGDNKEAISCGKKAVELKPIKLDALESFFKEQDLMEIYIFTGNYDLAMDKIEFLLSTPSDLSVGRVMIDPLFDKIRSLPRFKRILSTTYKTRY